MATVYSTQFYDASVTYGAIRALYTVPGNYVAVLRDIQVYNAAGSTTYYTIYGSPGGTPVIFGSLAPGVSAEWQGRKVLPPGTVIECDPLTNNIYVSISGYLLEVS